MENYVGNALAQISQLKQQDFQNQLASDRNDRESQLQNLQINQLKTNQAAQEQQRNAERTIAASRFIQQAAAQPGADPKAVAENVAPDFIKQYEATHGEGSWAQVQPEQILPMAKFVEQHAMAALGQGPAPPKILTFKKDETAIAQNPITGEINPKPVYESNKPDIGNVNPGDFTPESVKKYAASGNYSDLVRMYKPSEGAGAAASSIDTYKNDPALRRTAAIAVLSDPARMRDYATFGAAGQGIRTLVNQEIGQVKKETGMSDADMVSLRARAKADASNLTKLTAQNAQIEQAEGLMKANGQRALDLINMVDQTGIPLVEGITRSARAKAGGVDAAELESVMTAFQAEVARLLTSGPTMNGVLSDSARAEVAHMSPKSMSADQAKRVINRIFTEAEIRHGLNLDQINKAASGVAVGATPTAQPTPQPTPTAQPQSGPVKVASPAEAAQLPVGTQFITPDGQLRVRH